jgi:malto-oligosyltrehalose synthase
MIPRAIYRLQLTKDFTFGDAARIIPYLTAFGISHVYASPILRARPGSPHGYDVIDPTRVNPELGGEDGLRAFVSVLRHAGLGLIVDIVPNHMYAGAGNEWWNDVLRRGRASAYAKFFDIDWQPENTFLKDKVLLPILGKPYGEALADGELKLAEAPDGEWVLRYFDHTLPIAPDSVSDIGGNASVERLHAVLERQHFRLAWWRTAPDEINWRRFFDITELVGLRMEEPEVFEATHATLFRLYAEGLIDGLRVDHVDGLADPGAYCLRLRTRLGELEAKRPAAAPSGRAYLVVEKILGRGEHLPSAWQTDGVVGYDFMNEVSAVLHDPAGEMTLTSLWTETSGRTGSFEAEEIVARREVLERSFGAQLEAIVAGFARTAQSNLATRDISRGSLRRCLIELLTQFRVYRTYTGGSEDNETFLDVALDAARRNCLPDDWPTLDQLGWWLRHDPTSRTTDHLRIKFRQLTAPLAAKSVEDTAFYRYGRLLSRTDVGFDAECFSLAPDRFHEAMRDRLSRFPHALLETATHDHKRGEDMRARLAVLSERAEEWSVVLRSCLAMNGELRRTVAGTAAPSPGDELMLYQTIVGAWPPLLTLDDDAGRDAFVARLGAWQQKAMREAKLATAWTAPNEPYEKAAAEFLTRFFAERGGALRQLAEFAHRIGAAGAVNGLTQLVLKVTSPGVPDFYQGTEFWDLSLVDPDNRRPVDYAWRQAALRDLHIRAAHLRSWRDGRVKQAVAARALAVRRERPELFAQGEYTPLAIAGPATDHVIAFTRRLGTSFALVVVARLAASLLAPGDGLTIPSDRWGDTYLQLGDELSGVDFEDALSGRKFRGTAGLPIADLIPEMPVALFVNNTSAELKR